MYVYGDIRETLPYRYHEKRCRVMDFLPHLHIFTQTRGSLNGIMHWVHPSYAGNLLLSFTQNSCLGAGQWAQRAMVVYILGWVVTLIVLILIIYSRHSLVN